MKCPRCGGIVMGSARTCLIHGDQLDVGGKPVLLETVKDQRRVNSARIRRAAPK
jgi:hypothetical protein